MPVCLLYQHGRRQPSKRMRAYRRKLERREAERRRILAVGMDA